MTCSTGQANILSGLGCRIYVRGGGGQRRCFCPPFTPLGFNKIHKLDNNKKKSFDSHNYMHLAYNFEIKNNWTVYAEINKCVVFLQKRNCSIYLPIYVKPFL